jgi:hypothetical protein
MDTKHTETPRRRPLGGWLVATLSAAAVLAAPVAAAPVVADRVSVVAWGGGTIEIFD